MIGRLLIQSGKRLDTLTDNNFDDLLAASAARHGRERPAAITAARRTLPQVMFHLGVFAEQPVNATSLLRQSFAERMRDATPALRDSLVADLDRLTATHTRSTVTGTASRLNHFAAHLAAIDPACSRVLDVGSAAIPAPAGVHGEAVPVMWIPHNGIRWTAGLCARSDRFWWLGVAADVRIARARRQRPSESNQPINAASEVQSGSTSGVGG